MVMSVPAKLLITYQTAAESDFGKALSSLPGGCTQSIALIMEKTVLMSQLHHGCIAGCSSCQVPGQNTDLALQLLL